MIPIIICSLPGTGKTTLAKILSKKYNLKFYDGGDILKETAKDLGYNIGSKNFWDTKDGMKFLDQRKKDPNFDLKVDKKWIEILDKGNCVGTSWTMPWLYKGKCIKIWLSASIETRAKRICKRDRIDFEKAKEILIKRDKENKELYFKLYRIKFGEDFSPFDVIINLEKDVDEELLKELDKTIAILNQ